MSSENENKEFQLRIKEALEKLGVAEDGGSASPRPNWAQHLQSFEYKPIDVVSGEIRILTLHQGEKNDVLRCSVRHRSANETAESFKYTALSYTWGAPTSTRPILIDGCLHHVTANLEAALVNLRLKDENVDLWVDAVCINQSDIDERNRHVQVMRQVYENANRVMIWLGPSGEDSELAMRTIRALDETQQYLDKLMESTVRAPLGRRGMHPDIVTPMRYKVQATIRDEHSALCVTSGGDGTKEFASKVRRALQKLFERDWWQRVWIIQEATTPNVETVFVCGDQTAPLSAFVGFQRLWSDLETRQSSPGWDNTLQLFWFNRLLTIYNWRSMEANQAQPVSYLKILSLVKYFERSVATDGRDKIYALIGLANDIDAKAYNVDYKMRPSHVCTYLTRYLMEHHGNLDVLGCCYQPSPLSWSPHWIWGYTPLTPFCKTVVKSTALDRYNYFSTRDGMKLYVYDVNSHSDPVPAYSASKDSSISVRFFDQEDKYGLSRPRVSIRGFVVDKIKEAPLGSGALQSHWHRWQSLEGEKKWEKIVMGKKAANYVHTGESMLEAFRRTLVADVLKYADHLYRRGAAMLWDVDEIVDCNTSDYVCEQYVGLMPLHCKDMTRGRGIFTTEKGYMGLTALGAGVGDLVCILYGGQVLYVLHEEEEEQGAYTLTGECYVHGLMDGEAMVGFESGSYEERDFVLK